MLSGGVVLPRERHSEPQYDLFAGKGGRYLLLARLLDRMICTVDRRIQTMSEVLKEIQRIQEWEDKQGAPLSSKASTQLSAMLTDQRAALSVDEHNRRVYAEEQARFSTYKLSVAAWLEARLAELTNALTHHGVSTARKLTPDESEKRSAKCSRIKLNGHGSEVRRAGALSRPRIRSRQRHHAPSALLAPKRLLLARDPGQHGSSAGEARTW